MNPNYLYRKFMEKSYLRVRFEVPKKGDYCRPTAWVSKGRKIQRITITSDFCAPRDVLARFDESGRLKPGETAPKWLQREIARFMQFSWDVVRKHDLIFDDLKQTTSPGLTLEVWGEIYKDRTEAEGKPKARKERG